VITHYYSGPGEIPDTSVEEALADLDSVGAEVVEKLEFDATLAVEEPPRAGGVRDDGPRPARRCPVSAGRAWPRWCSLSAPHGDRSARSFASRGLALSHGRTADLDSALRLTTDYFKAGAPRQHLATIASSGVVHFRNAGARDLDAARQGRP